ncbi:MAG: rhomboid family intramembrane serine protease [Cyclobacteriaceae bacterium]|nr:rhomboid family intramembrane serine protease [Cyclobacteriaceae bacterium]
MSRNRSVFDSSAIPFRLVFVMWLSFSIQFFYQIDLGFLGIKPRSFSGLIGIFTAPLIHGSYMHLLSNTFPLLFLGTLLFFFYDRIGTIVFFRCYLFTNLLVWVFSPRVSYHIGASGLIYGLAAFLIVFGVLRQDFLSILISIAVVIAYGGIFYGVMPMDPRVSWESHLAGALVGSITAFNLADKKRIR